MNSRYARDIAITIIMTAVILTIVFFIPRRHDTEPEHTEGRYEAAETVYRFRNAKLLNSHYDKHGIDMGFSSAEEYEAAASAVINNPDALSKIEKEDGDMCYYVEATNEFVILSKDGYIRTYFLPDSGRSYFDRQ